jgi:quinoprotein glucose dehydrogenase
VNESASRTRPKRVPNWSFFILRLIYALILLAIAASLVIGGLQLIALRGSPYYLAAGLLTGVAGLALLWPRGWRLAATAFFILMVGTYVWALWESGLNGWALAPRVLAPAVIGIPLLIAALRHGRRAARWVGAACLIGGVALAVSAVAAGQYHPLEGPQRLAIGGTASGGADWTAFAPGGNHFSSLAQITPANVSGLKVAWSTVIGPTFAAAGAQNQAVPLKIGDHLYTCLPFGRVYELDPETGRVRWHFEAKVNPQGLYKADCRGLAYYAVPNAQGPCAQRLYVTSSDGQLLAIDALTGRACAGFGNGGSVNLLDGIRQRAPGYYGPTSGPTLIRGKLVVNAYVADGQYVGEPSGVIRAFDAVTGKLAWAWDLGRPGEHGAPPPGKSYTSGTPNSWAPMSADEVLGLVYVPTGNSTPDYWAGHRSAQSNRYASSLVAIDAETGEPRWSFQTVHYDVWDYDVGSQPILFTLRTPQGPVPAVIQPTKRGQLFVLDRRNGKPLFPVVERPAPQEGAVEKLSPTQPWSPGMPDMAGPHLTEASMWGITPIDQLWCRIAFRQSRYAGGMTPPGLSYGIEDPGYAGGIEWGSASIDEGRQIAYILSNRLVNRNRLLPRSDPLARGVHAAPQAYPGGLVPQEGTPYLADIKAFLSPIGAPCQQPPWGLINAIDLATGKVLWSRPLGTGRDLGPLGLKSHLPLTMGLFTFGGALGTQSGLVFAAASQDHGFRAFDGSNGRLLFEADLPQSGSGSSTPMSYVSARNRRQYVVISSETPAANHGGKFYGAITAFALP